MSKWKHFEYIVYKIYTELAPYADVRINDKILGRDTGIERQIDISVRSKIAGHEILIIIQVKDYKRAADVNVVGELYSVIKDVGAQKGIIYCKSGFTKAAILQAKNLKIDLLSVLEAISDDIIFNYKFPTLKESVIVHWKEFEISIQEVLGDKFIDKINEEILDNIMKCLFSLSIKTRLSKETTLISQFYEQWDILKGCTEKKKYTFNFEGGIFVYDNKNFQISNFVMEAEFERYLLFKYIPLFDQKLLKEHINNSEKNITIFVPEEIPFFNDGSWESLKEIRILDSNVPTLHVEIFNFKFNTFRRFNVLGGLNFSKRRLYDKSLFINTESNTH